MNLLLVNVSVACKRGLPVPTVMSCCTSCAGAKAPLPTSLKLIRHTPLSVNVTTPFDKEQPVDEESSVITTVLPDVTVALGA
jgi:hypothetical protein